jgi:ribose transport system substrate-binding protein
VRRFPLWLPTLALLAFGCGKEETPPAASPVTPGSKPVAATTTAAISITAAELDGVQHATKPYKIVLIVKTKNNPFFIPMITAFEEASRKLGFAAEVQAAAQESSYEQQVALVQAEVSKGANAILITPADSKALVPALKKAADAGVLIIDLDNRLDPETVKAQGLSLGGYVGADNVMGGEKAGIALLDALGGKGNVAILEGIRGVDNAEARKKGFQLAVSPKLKIVAMETGEWETEKAYSKTLAILAAHPDLNGIFCANDNMAIGAMKAISEKGKKGLIKVVGYDDIPGVGDAITSGEMTATIDQHPEFMGQYGARMALGILEGNIKRGGELLVDLETIKRRSAVSPVSP